MIGFYPPQFSNHVDFQNITQLDLSRNSIGAEGLKYLADALRTMPVSYRISPSRILESSSLSEYHTPISFVG